MRAGSPAAKVGVEKGTRLVAVDGIRIAPAVHAF
ncbi:hypothetical protein [Sphingomicrobium arenosum]